ncbi:MAG: 50S ribosomal protein L17 [Verrucomicrobiae bacterium]|nr:50S ribosomal protein L17 [Verrucomicrobiae bacterium]
MRHRNKTLKLGRTKPHREQMLANLVCSLILKGQVRTTRRKARAASALADRMITLGKAGDLHSRRLAISRLRQKGAVSKLFGEVAPRCAQRNGGYTRVLKLAVRRIGDAADMAILEWTDQAPAADAAPKSEKPADQAKPAAA